MTLGNWAALHVSGAARALLPALTPKYNDAMKRSAAPVLFLVVVGLLAGCTLFSNRAPVARFTVSPLSGETPLLVRFDARGSSDPNGTITEYSWDFGDGQSGEGDLIEHIFAPVATTTYIATLTVTDDEGASATRTQSIEVRASSQSDNNPPSARFTFIPTYGNSPLEVQFDAALSSDADGSVVIYSWDFGDGTTGSGIQISHTYTALANTNYAVTLLVYDDDGASASSASIVSVYVTQEVPFEGPTASFTTTAPVKIYDSPSLPNLPSLFEVTLDPRISTPAPGHTIEHYIWNFGDGESLSIDHEGAVTHTYSSGSPSRTFVVSLTVIDEQGLRDSAVRNVTVSN